MSERTHRKTRRSGDRYDAMRIGMTGGNILHGEILPEGMFGNRPVPGYSGYRTPVENLYLCGSGAWPGGAVFGAPGRNCALAVLVDLETGAHAPDVVDVR